MTEAPPPTEPAETVAQHVGLAFAPVLNAGRDVVAARRAHYLGHFTGKICDFGFDVLHEVAATPARARRLRGACLLNGRLLAAAVEEVDEDLRGMMSGALIRTLVHGDRGAFSCVDIVPGRHVVGLVLDRADESSLARQPAVVACDRAVSDLVTGQRGLLSLGSQNPGGTDQEQADDDQRPGTGGTPKVHVERGAPSSPIPPEVVGGAELLFNAVIAPADVHYLALCADGVTALSVDCLDHDDVSRFFTQIGVDERRTFLRSFTRSVPSIVERLTRITATVTGSQVLRLVLDIELGAIYYYRLSRDVFLIGVTLDQDQVGTADRKVADVAVGCRALVESAD
jgi:hypothetical protein